jgi:hypothetical protein
MKRKANIQLRAQPSPTMQKLLAPLSGVKPEPQLADMRVAKLGAAKALRVIHAAVRRAGPLTEEVENELVNVESLLECLILAGERAGPAIVRGAARDIEIKYLLSIAMAEQQGEQPAEQAQPEMETA